MLHVTGNKTVMLGVLGYACVCLAFLPQGSRAPDAADVRASAEHGLALTIATEIAPAVQAKEVAPSGQTAASKASTSPQDAPAPEPLFIAGLQPDRRPELAPRITVFEKDAAWYRRALTGVSTPYPASLRFLEDQGAWYTPFIHPGMTGPYDLRGWHVLKGGGS